MYNCVLRFLILSLPSMFFVLLRRGFCDWEGKWQLLHAPGETSINRRHTPVQLLVADIPHPCLLSLKTDRKQRNSEEKSLFDSRQAPEAAPEHSLANKNKLIHKVLTALGAYEKTNGTRGVNCLSAMLVNQFLSLYFFLSACCLVSLWFGHCAFLDKVNWRHMSQARGVFTAVCTFMQITCPSVMSCPSSHWITWL